MKSDTISRLTPLLGSDCEDPEVTETSSGIELCW
jgi:hypothetical protein